jgi:ATP-dependent DNA ligase
MESSAKGSEVESSRPRSCIMYMQHVEEHGKMLFEQGCCRNLEGIVAKRKLGIYKDDGPGG